MADVSLLGQDGSVGKAVPILPSGASDGSAVYTDQGFLVALSSVAGAVVVRVGLDGSIGPARSLGANTEYPQIAWTGSEARVVYGYGNFSTSTYAMKYARLDSTGTPLGSPAGLGGDAPIYFASTPIVAVGTDTVALLPWVSPAGGLSQVDVARVATDGSFVHSPYVVGQAGPLDGLSQYQFALRGPDVIAAWLAEPADDESGGPTNTYPATIGIARVSP